ncbi:ribosomal protein S9 [Sphaerochaeta pleomorpha str. Grapes]|uniref:Small ribosomal subunit protein uS9 n=1 Tax=Sphaerochaeta pleomorpha (strain ATCC BAA-1885 / DSM 22778 / Grapes) TaxID=158190 RepID=G8QUS1_SPHPG|nr:30S ribosomal protein S9 [Sphaerochaeta pleomorpha]AEV30379.1 ribosomal protein S9 [Sphaerochaeta pleomorpha str. Grapes]
MAKKEVKKVVDLGHGVGRRKTAVARVYLREGEGKIIVNGRDVDTYFANPMLVFIVKQPLQITDTLTKYDILINVVGGGPSGQAGACRHGISRALVENDETYRAALHTSGFMTRDSRMVERKKYGQPGARRKFQFSKR